jgi:threonine dehydratase
MQPTLTPNPTPTAATLRAAPTVSAASPPPISRERVAATYELIRPYIRRTPVIEVDLADFGLDAHPLVCKLELLQHAGSFKPRGAFANLLTRTVPDAGVVAASGGNHGLAVAFASNRLRVPATIFVPSVAAATKRDRIQSLGARLQVVDGLYANALEASREFVSESGAMEIHAFDQPATLLGQGSVGLELEQQRPELDTLLVSVGGGGLIGGIAAWFEGRVKLIAVEPRTAPTLFRALEAGHPVEAEAGGIAADSLAPRKVGELMYPLAAKYVHRAVLVEDDDIHKAQQAIWRVLRVACEAGGAAAMAALLSQRYRPEPGERVGVVLCGANTDAVNF